MEEERGRGGRDTEEERREVMRWEEKGVKKRRRSKGR